MWKYFAAGGPLMWPLLLCSIAALAVILERFWFWKRLDLKKDEAVCRQFLQNFAKGGDADFKDGGGALAAMLRAGLNAPAGESEKAMEAVALEALGQMRRGMNILDTIITAAPMLGIMGTVLGIISSFDMLGAAGAGEPKEVIAGIAQALITTAAGLGIAVLTIFPYNYFNSRMDNAQDLLEIYGTRLQLAMAGKNRGQG